MKLFLKFFAATAALATGGYLFTSPAKQETRSAYLDRDKNVLSLKFEETTGPRIWRTKSGQTTLYYLNEGKTLHITSRGRYTWPGDAREITDSDLAHIERRFTAENPEAPSYAKERMAYVRGVLEDAQKLTR